jgi:hypothetical protein
MLFGTGGVSMFNGAVPEGSKSSAAFAYSFGASLVHPFGEESEPKFGVLLGAAFDSRAMRFHPSSSDDPRQTIRLNYFSIEPGFLIAISQKLFLVPAIGIGIPVSGSQSMDPKSYILTTESSPDPIGEIRSTSISTTYINKLIAARLKIVFPIMGDLGIILQGSYPFTNAIAPNSFWVSGQRSTAFTIDKNRIPSLQIGFAYAMPLISYVPPLIQRQ